MAILKFPSPVGSSAAVGVEGAEVSCCMEGDIARLAPELICDVNEEQLRLDAAVTSSEALAVAELSWTADAGGDVSIRTLCVLGGTAQWHQM